MEIDIADAIKNGFGRTFEKTGLVLAGFYFMASILQTVFAGSVTKTLASEFGAATATSSSTSPLALSMPLFVSGPVLLVLSLASVVLTITALRTLVDDYTEKIPKELYTRNMGWNVANIVVGGIAFALILAAAYLGPAVPGLLLIGAGASGIGLGAAGLVGTLLALIGTLAGVALGTYLMVALYYWNVEVAVRDVSFTIGFRNSYEMTEGHRFRLFVLGLAVAIISALASSLGGVVSFAGELAGISGLEVAGAIVSTLIGSFTGVFTLATLAQAYNQMN
ncbi:MAG: hypothetical protein ABEJ03_00595 [Candidatus Nanohaloarchaea archaeon]